MTTTDQTTYVVQGEFAVASSPDVLLSTILGSCVAVCLHDPVRRLGGMNHFLLPVGPSENFERPIRYGVNAMEMLINTLLKQGAEKNRLQAKLFGAAQISTSLRDIGRSNAEFAHDFLIAENIPCVGESLRGNAARRLLYRPATGAARVLFVPSTEVETEGSLPTQDAKTADVTLF